LLTEESRRLRRRTIRRSVRTLVLDRDSHTCQRCGRTAPEVKLEVDHIVPVAEGGTDALDNLQTLCRECNGGKSDLLLPHRREMVVNEAPWFDIYGGSTGSPWDRFTPSWRIQRVYGDDTGMIEWRFRSWYHVDEWRALRTAHFDRDYLSTVIDFSKEPVREDDRIGQMALGLEIRCQAMKKWRHELHVWPLVRTEHPGNSFAPIHMEPQREEARPI
jgi:hypothetical protein